MTMDISVHDNFLVSYEVLCRQREIRLHTEFRDKEPIECTDVIFRGVEAYHFDHDNFETIIFDITEVPVEDILVQTNHASMRAGDMVGPALGMIRRRRCVPVLPSAAFVVFRSRHPSGCAAGYWRRASRVLATSVSVSQCSLVRFLKRSRNTGCIDPGIERLSRC